VLTFAVVITAAIFFSVNNSYQNEAQQKLDLHFISILEIVVMVLKLMKENVLIHRPILFFKV